jgi:3-hydroxyacyl-CoA dehydrogenase
MNEITNVAVLGSGVMGSGIAALLANAGVQVHLLDIVPASATDRNMLAKGGVEKQLKSNPSGFTHSDNAKRITAGNLEDDLSALAQADWIIEVVLEDLAVKQRTYRLINEHRKEGSIVSSNTSTLPLHVLTHGTSEAFKRDFMITHFFNPPRFLPLLEVTGGASCNHEHITRIKQFAEVRLGKGVVLCKDTAGFLANRIGIFWLLTGLLEAIKAGVSVEEADSAMSKPIGVPKTALFGLYDLIGIDLMPLIAKAMLATLPKGDRFHAVYEEPDVIKAMIAEGYTGRKGKGGFYKMEAVGGKKTKFAKNLQTGEYAPASEVVPDAVLAAKAGLREMFNYPDKVGEFAKATMVQTLHYAASLLPEISDDILNIDAAMRLGFAWKWGPFELIDKLGNEQQSGADWLAQQCEKAGLTTPELLKKASGKSFYRTHENIRQFLNLSGEYEEFIIHPDAYMLADATFGKTPVLKNGSAQLWDIGDGIACLELTTKMNTIDDGVIEMINRSIAKVQSDFKGLVIATDAEKFSLGANLPFFMSLANRADWDSISGVIKAGQNAMMALKYAPFPVVASLAGMALGGGCELTLHCDAVASHIESYQGLVEVGVGLIPAWGGCKEMLLRMCEYQAKQPQIPKEAIPVASKVFEQIMLAKVAGSAHEAKEMLLLNPHSIITMNRTRLLPDAKALCLRLSENYTTPTPPILHLGGAGVKTALQISLDNLVALGKATPHDVVIGTHLAEVLSGGEVDSDTHLSEQNILDLEHDNFIELLKTRLTRDRIEYMLAHNKPLRN